MYQMKLKYGRSVARECTSLEIIIFGVMVITVIALAIRTSAIFCLRESSNVLYGK